MSNPSVIQIAYAKKLSDTVFAQLIDSIETNQDKLCKVFTGTEYSNHVVALPDSIVHSIAAAAAESLRSRVLHYFREIGVWPE